MRAVPATRAGGRPAGVAPAGAAMAQLDLMLALVARYAGADVAHRCARYLLLDERHSQSRYMAVEFLAAADDDVARARAWALLHLDRPVSVDDVAAAVGLAPRTFARRVRRAMRAELGEGPRQVRAATGVAGRQGPATGAADPGTPGTGGA